MHRLRFIFEDDKDIILEAGCDACTVSPSEDLPYGNVEFPEVGLISFLSTAPQLMMNRCFVDIILPGVSGTDSLIRLVILPGRFVEDQEFLSS